jgi:hypothetical protein
MKRARLIYDAFRRAVGEGCVPFGYYGPETCRWATPDEMRRFGLEDSPMVHLDESGEIDCEPTWRSVRLPALAVVRRPYRCRRRRPTIYARNQPLEPSATEVARARRKQPCPDILAAG